MSTINNENLWSKLTAYVFGSMSVNEEKEMDDYLDQHEEAADFANSLLSYCQNEAISDPKTLEAKLSADQAAYRKFKLTPGTKSTGNRRWIISIIVFIIALTAIFYIKWKDANTKPAIDTTPRAGLIEFWDQEKSKLGSAGSPNDVIEWEQLFIEKEFSETIASLENLIAQNPPTKMRRQIYYLCVLYIWDTPPAIDRLRMLLPKLDGSVYVENINKQIKLADIDIEDNYLPKN